MFASFNRPDWRVGAANMGYVPVDVIILLGILGAVVAVIANSKGFDATGWFIYGFLLFPVALAHVIVKPAIQTEVPTASEPERKCPDCGESIKAVAVVCRYCGNRELPTLSKAEVVENDEWMANLHLPAKPPQPTLWQKLWWNPHAGDRKD